MPEFDHFVVFAEMRTGSNFLESNLNAFDDLTCHGEAFNPHFLCYPNQKALFGYDQAKRDSDAIGFLRALRDRTPGLGGFRYFHDHDPRILDAILDDPRCAKVILTRNPAESYVSWKIAQNTGQWKLTNVRKRKETRARFDAVEFETHLGALQAFQIKLLNRLQRSGQTAFYISYEDLQDVEVINGLARWLGSAHQLDSLDKALKPQNPAALASKVANFEEMARALDGMDRFNLSRTPNFEPRRGPVVPGYLACARTPLLYMPIRSGPESTVRQWMAALDEVGEDALLGAFKQNTLRQWMRRNPGHRRFTVLRHPALRAHHAFATRIVNTGEGSFGHIRRTLARAHGINLPERNLDRDSYRAAFVAFLRFLEANLNGQTGIRVDPCWASQTTVVQGMGDLALPDALIREEEMNALLPMMAHLSGRSEVPDVEEVTDPMPFTLDEIYDDEIEELTHKAYQRDYITFGFTRWR